jgi:glycerophosphoryl diester phosphodiesterase
MNFRPLVVLCVAALFTADCEQNAEVSIPMFTDGGLLRSGKALTRSQLMLFEGMFEVHSGSELLGNSVAVRTSPGTVSLLTDKNAGFSVLGAACLPDRRVVVEGYWQYPTLVEAGLIRLFVEPPELAHSLCDGAETRPNGTFSLSGNYGHDSVFPQKPLVLDWDRELKPWRGRFFTVAHHGACEITDYCGVTPNTIETIRLAERVGSNATELDVRMTKDGIPIFFHDPTLSGALVHGLFCNGAVPDLTLAELRGACQLTYGEAIPTVEEALDMMVNETELEGTYLDMKVADGVLATARLASKVVTRLKERNSNADPSDDRTFSPIIGIPTQEVLDAWHEAKTVLKSEGLELPPCLIEWDSDLVISEGCVGWGPTWTEGPQVDNVHKVQDAGAGVIYWTINQSEFMDAFLVQAHPNGIITARAALLFHHYQTLGTVPPLRKGQEATP